MSARCTSRSKKPLSPGCLQTTVIGRILGPCSVSTLPAERTILVSAMAISRSCVLQTATSVNPLSLDRPAHWAAHWNLAFLRKSLRFEAVTFRLLRLDERCWVEGDNSCDGYVPDDLFRVGVGFKKLRAFLFIFPFV